tara:strand:- start:138 stop:887 length:750 start_codon:yes stop_codon:yes gene_type:complete
MIVYPNAKLNIGLNVLEKRVDGYHNLSSIFYPVKKLYDILEIVPATRFYFSSSGIRIPTENNICIRAFNILKKDFDIKNIKIHLHKRIPIGAGLGGGSSDGAFVLKVLNTLFDLGLSNSQLEKYALQLGADCPFFIENKPKYVTGIGEKMKSINLDLAEYELRFNFPDFCISTAEAYSEIKPIVPKVSLLELVGQPMDRWRSTVKNDFEVSIFSKYPQLENIKNQFYNDGAIYASMSGSGSVIYGLFKK